MEKNIPIPRNIMMLGTASFVILSLIVFPHLSFGAPPVQHYSSRSPSSGLGTIEFTIKILKGDSPDYKNIVLLQASSSDGKEFYEIQAVGDDLLVLRDFGQCIRSANRTAHNFRPGETHKLTLTWNGPSTRFYIDGHEIKGFNLMVVNDFHKRGPFLKFSGTDSFEISGLTVSSQGPGAADLDDREFVKNNRCPDLAQLLGEKSQEEYKGTAFYGFPNQTLRDKVKSYLDLLPGPMAASVKHIVFVEDAEKMTGAQGLTTSQGTFYLRTGFEPSTFFHEATHVYDFHSQGTRSMKWEKEFMGKHEQADFATAKEDPGHKESSILGMHDATAAHEQLADFVGQAYEFYVKKESPEKFSRAFGPQTNAKLEFLLRNGLITRKVSDNLTAVNR